MEKIQMKDIINESINDKKREINNFIRTPISEILKIEKKINISSSPYYKVTPSNNVNKIKSFAIDEFYKKSYEGKNNSFNKEKNYPLSKINILNNKFQINIEENNKKINTNNSSNNQFTKKIFYLNSLNLINNNNYKQNNIDNNLNIENNNENLKNENELNTCNCENTNCLKMYCECLKKGLWCRNDCKCLNCKNNSNFYELRNKVLEKIKKKNPKVFNPKYDKISNFVENGLYNKEEGEKMIHTKGCNCKKGCNKKYCECFGFGTFCTKLCNCQNCHNYSLK